MEKSIVTNIKEEKEGTIIQGQKIYKEHQEVGHAWRSKVRSEIEGVLNKLLIQKSGATPGNYAGVGTKTLKKGR